ncbi:hypothetical protein DSO57_1033373 [Entomophthora muscae]|uniref:Uncharacterized protein n=1 Tax=Entomophthora muscae TaxID=34485 RepID=A0ACC2SP85_9FUNG|nr:hypothetical protein DSO57_1033373 [Entomophthora muscae]
MPLCMLRFTSHFGNNVTAPVAFPTDCSCCLFATSCKVANCPASSSAKGKLNKASWVPTTGAASSMVPGYVTSDHHMYCPRPPGATLPVQDQLTFTSSVKGSLAVSAVIDTFSTPCLAERAPARSLTSKLLLPPSILLVPALTFIS